MTDRKINFSDVPVKAVDIGGGLYALAISGTVVSSTTVTANQGTANATPWPTSDAGPSWTSKYGVSGAAAVSANASSTPLVITDAPTSEQKIVLDDLILSVDTAMTLILRTTTGVVILAKFYLPANAVIQITPRGRIKAPTKNQTLELLASASGNIAATAVFHSEV
jgi:hypothetical protein